MRVRLEAPAELSALIAGDPGLDRRLLPGFDRGELIFPSLPCVPLRVASLEACARYSARFVIEVEKGTPL